MAVQAASMFDAGLDLDAKVHRAVPDDAELMTKRVDIGVAVSASRILRPVGRSSPEPPTKSGYADLERKFDTYIERRFL